MAVGIDRRVVGRQRRQFRRHLRRKALAATALVHDQLLEVGSHCAGRFHSSHSRFAIRGNCRASARGRTSNGRPPSHATAASVSGSAVLGRRARRASPLPCAGLDSPLHRLVGLFDRDPFEFEGIEGFDHRCLSIRNTPHPPPHRRREQGGRAPRQCAITRLRRGRGQARRRHRAAPRGRPSESGRGARRRRRRAARHSRYTFAPPSAHHRSHPMTLPATVAPRNPRPRRARRKAAHGARHLSAHAECARRRLQPEDEPRPARQRDRGGGAGDDRPPARAVADRRVERRPRDALRAQRRARARGAVAGGRAARHADAARPADGRRAAHRPSACTGSPTSRPSRGSCTSWRPARRARSSSCCRASPARARRAGRTCCPAPPAIAGYAAATAGADDAVTVGEIAALKANVAQLQDELAAVQSTVARLCAELGIAPLTGSRGNQDGSAHAPHRARPRHRRRADRVPAGLQHGAPDRRRLAARLHRRPGQGVRDRDPGRRDARGLLGLPGAPAPVLARSVSDRRAQRFASMSPSRSLPAAVLGLVFGKAIKAYLFKPVPVALRLRRRRAGDPVGGAPRQKSRPDADPGDERRRTDAGRTRSRSAARSASRSSPARRARARRSSAACCSGCRATLRPSFRSFWRSPRCSRPPVTRCSGHWRSCSRAATCPRFGEGFVGAFVSAFLRPLADPLRLASHDFRSVRVVPARLRRGCRRSRV